MNDKHKPNLFIVIMFFVIIFTGCSSTSNSPVAQSHFKSIDVGNEPWIPIIEFWEQYHIAVETDENWVTDPIEVALRYAGYPNPDNLNPDTVFVYYDKANKAVVIISHSNLMDDSTYAFQDRIDLIKVDNIWEIEWAGYRQQCRRGLTRSWVKSPCP